MRFAQTESDGSFADIHRVLEQRLNWFDSAAA